MFVLLVHTRTLCLWLWAEMKLIARQPIQCGRCMTGYGLGDTVIVFRFPAAKRFIFFLGKESLLCLNILVNKTNI